MSSVCGNPQVREGARPHSPDGRAAVAGPGDLSALAKSATWLCMREPTGQPPWTRKERSFPSLTQSSCPRFVPCFLCAGGFLTAMTEDAKVRGLRRSPALPAHVPFAQTSLNFTLQRWSFQLSSWPLSDSHLLLTLNLCHSIQNSLWSALGPGFCMSPGCFLPPFQWGEGHVSLWVLWYRCSLELCVQRRKDHLFPTVCGVSSEWPQLCLERDSGARQCVQPCNTKVLPQRDLTSLQRTHFSTGNWAGDGDLTPTDKGLLLDNFLKLFFVTKLSNACIRSPTVAQVETPRAVCPGSRFCRGSLPGDSETLLPCWSLCLPPF